MRDHAVFGHADVLGVRSAVRPDRAEDPVAGRESADVASDPLDHAGELVAEHGVARSREPEEESRESRPARAPHAVGDADDGRLDPHEQVAVADDGIVRPARCAPIRVLRTDRPLLPS